MYCAASEWPLEIALLLNEERKREREWVRRILCSKRGMCIHGTMIILSRFALYAHMYARRSSLSHSFCVVVFKLHAELNGSCEIVCARGKRVNANNVGIWHADDFDWMGNARARCTRDARQTAWMNGDAAHVLWYHNTQVIGRRCLFNIMNWCNVYSGAVCTHALFWASNVFAASSSWYELMRERDRLDSPSTLTWAECVALCSAEIGRFEWK